MSNTRSARLVVAVSEVSLTTSFGAKASGRYREPLALLFSGVVKEAAPDFKGDAWDLPDRLEKRTIAVRCLSAPRAAAEAASRSAIGWCQLCPIACDLDVAVEVDCCSNLFHVLKNTAGFGGGQAGPGLTLTLDVADDGDEGKGRRDAAFRLAVTRMAITASRALKGAAAPLSDTAMSSSASTVPSSVPVS